MEAIARIKAKKRLDAATSVFAAWLQRLSEQ